MGVIISRLLDRLSSPKERRMLMLGLDAAGKTTTLYAMHLGELVHTIPTIGFNVETVQYKKVSMTIFDVGGQERLRRLWRHYFRGTEGLIYVVDSTDVERMKEAAEELHSMMRDPEMRDATVLVLANKQDLPNALDASTIAQELGMDRLTGKFSWFVQPCSAKSRQGVYEGIDWLVSAMDSGDAGRRLR